ncbi:serine/threonine protein kinase, partial [Streptomyces sp. ventii]|nr:serine/threonine protein kinase [Streptomyces spiramenti]
PRAAGDDPRRPAAAASEKPGGTDRPAAATALGADSGKAAGGESGGSSARGGSARGGSARGGSADGGTGASGPGDGGSGATTTGNGGRRRLVLILVALLATLAVLGALLVSRLADGDSGGDPGPGPTEPADDGTGDGGTDGAGGPDDDTADGGAGDSTGGPDGDQDPGDDAAPGEDGAAEGTEPEESGPPRNTPERDTDAPFPPEGPTGFARTVDLQYRFSMAMPQGWEQTGTAGRNSGAIYSHPSGPPPAVQVDFTTSPGSDAEQAWLELEPSVRDASTDYERVRIDSVEWRDYPTVSDWEFERTMAGTRVRVLNRGFRVDDGRGYAVMVTCVAAEWDGNDCRTLRETAFESFAPLG